MKRFFKEETIGFLIIWLLLMYYGSSRLFRDPGTFWHTVVGQHILGSHQVMTTDIFSFTFPGQPWLSQQWLIECLMAFIDQIGGLDGLLILTVTSLALLYTWLLRRMLNAGLHPLLAWLILGLALSSSAFHFHVRPHVASIIFLAITFGSLVNFDKNCSNIHMLFWLVPLFVVWSNSHGGVLGGLGTLFITICGWIVARLIHKESPLHNPRQAALMGLLFLGCCLSVLINPFGLELPKTWFSIVDSSVVANFIDEHLSVFKTGNWMVLVFGLFYIAALAGTLPAWPRVTWMIPLVWFVLALSRVRNGPLFAVTATIALADFFPEVRWARWLARKGSVVLQIRPVETQARRLSLTHGIIPALAILTAVVVSNIGASATRPAGQRLVRLDPKHWPLALLPELKDYESHHPAGTPIFNEMKMGGFLIFYTPRLRVFVDDRCDLYGDDFLLRLFQSDPAMIETWAGRYGFELALTESGSSFDRYLRSARGWQLVKQTAAGSLYRRLDEPTPQLSGK
jgi:hypothetical protein